VQLIGFTIAQVVLLGEFREDREALPTSLRYRRAKRLVALAFESVRNFFLLGATTFFSLRRKTEENSMLDIAYKRSIPPGSALRLPQKLTFLLNVPSDPQVGLK
jgi:hypothetical protein